MSLDSLPVRRGRKSKPNSFVLAWVVFGVVVLGVIVAIWSAATYRPWTSSDARRVSAIVAAKEAVAANLKYPDDAEFLDAYLTQEKYTKEWSVVGKVRAKNKLGVALTLPYRAGVKFDGNEASVVDVWVGE